MSIKQYSDNKEPKDVTGESDEAAGLLLLNELAHNEAVLWEQAQKLRTAATDLNAVGDNDAAEEAGVLNQQAGRLEGVARQVAHIREELKADPKKKISRTTTSSITATITQLMSSTDSELGEAHEIKDEVEHKVQEHHQAHATPSHKAAAPKPKEQKSGEKAVCKASGSKKTRTPTWTEKATTCGAHIKREYIAPIVAWGGNTLSHLKEDYLDPVLHSAPVDFTVNAVKTVTKTIVNTGKKVADVVLHPVDTIHSVVSGVAHAGATVIGRMGSAVSTMGLNIVGYFTGKSETHAHVENGGVSPKHKVLAPNVVAQVLALKMPQSIGMPKTHSVVDLLTPPPVFGALNGAGLLAAQS